MKNVEKAHKFKCRFMNYLLKCRAGLSTTGSQKSPVCFPLLFLRFALFLHPSAALIKMIVIFNSVFSQILLLDTFNSGDLLCLGFQVSGYSGLVGAVQAVSRILSDSPQCECTSPCSTGSVCQT